MKKLNEITVLKTPVFDVVSKEFEGTPFKPVGLNCPDWVMVVVLDRFNRTIAVKQTRWGCEDKTIEFPCGTVEPNEDPKTAAIRELKEETGFIEDIDESELTEIACINPNPAYFNNKMHIYHYGIERIPVENGFGKQNLDENEDCQMFVAPLEEVAKDIGSHGMGLAAIGALYRLFGWELKF